jgi:hypothetical protein
MEKKGGPQPATGPWFSSSLPAARPSVNKAEQKPSKAPSKKMAIPDNVVLIAGIIIVVVGGFFFFKFVLDKDKLWSFETNLNAAVTELSSSSIGTSNAVVIPLPGSAEQVCFNNYGSETEFGTEITLQPEKLDKFNVPNLYSVEPNLCVKTSGSLKVKMQYTSKGGGSFVAVYLSSPDASISPFTTYTPSPVVVPEVNENVETNQNETSEKSVTQVACESAASNNNCVKLAELGLITAEQCCSQFVLCC